MAKNIWVGSLPDGIDEDSFRSIFAGYGELVSARVFPDKWYGFVEFATDEEALQVATDLDGQMIGGKGIKIRLQEHGDKGKSYQGKAAGKSFGKAAGKGKFPSPYGGGDDGGKGGSGNNLWIGNLPDGMDEESFRAVLEPYGTLLSTKLFPDKWFGFADFSTPEEAAFAIQNLEGADFNGKPLKVKLATKKADAGAGGFEKGGGFAHGGFANGGFEQQSWGTKIVVGNSKGGKGKGAPFMAAQQWGGKPAADCAAGQGAHCASHYHILAGQNPAFSKGTKEGNLFVKNIPEPADDLMLYKLFAPFGQVLSVCTKATQYGTIGFVQYETAEQAEAALGYMNGKETSQGAVLDVSIKK